MPHLRKNIFRAALALAVWFCAMPAAACNVPVFRYALERWPAGAYQMTVYRSEDISREQQSLIEAVRKGTGLAVNANLLADDVNVSHLLNGLVVPAVESALPLVSVQYPATEPNVPVAWTGGLVTGELNTLLDSPARRAISQKLMTGTSAVYVLLEGGDAERDSAAATMLAEQLKKMEGEIVLPDLTDPNGAGPGGEQVDLLSNLPLKVGFAIVRISRTDPAERPFVRMLTGIDRKLIEESGPAVFAVFGRGRAMPPMFGAELTIDNVRAVARFLTSSCSCEVKELNPGVDLLIAADWNSLIEGRTPIVRPALIKGGTPVPIPPGLSAVAAVTTQPSAAAQDSGATHYTAFSSIVHLDMRLVGIGLATAVLVLTGLVLLRRAAR